MTELHTFDLTLEEIPVTLKKQDKTDWKCVLREMDGTRRDLFLNGQKSKIRMATKEIIDFRDLHKSLIEKCLYDLETNELVPAKEIGAFPAKVQSKLYNLCTKLNALTEDSETEVKND